MAAEALHLYCRRTGLASAGLATQSSSDLAAAEALKALRNTDEEAEGHEAMSQDEHDQPMQSAELATSFAPPVPLWVEGTEPLLLQACLTTVLLENANPCQKCQVLLKHDMQLQNVCGSLQQICSQTSLEASVNATCLLLALEFVEQLV